MKQTNKKSIVEEVLLTLIMSGMINFCYEKELSIIIIIGILLFIAGYMYIDTEKDIFKKGFDYLIQLIQSIFIGIPILRIFTDIDKNYYNLLLLIFIGILVIYIINMFKIYYIEYSKNNLFGFIKRYIYKLS